MQCVSFPGVSTALSPQAAKTMKIAAMIAIVISTTRVTVLSCAVSIVTRLEVVHAPESRTVAPESAQRVVRGLIATTAKGQLLDSPAWHGGPTTGGGRRVCGEIFPSIQQD